MFSNPTYQQHLASVVRTAQVIMGALIFGVAFFGVIAITVAGGKAPDGEPLITYIGLGVFLLGIAGRLFVLPLVVGASLRKIADGTFELPPNLAPKPEEAQDERALEIRKLGLVFLTRTIIGGALLEGAAFFVLIAYMVEGQWISLMAAAILLAGLVLQYPSPGWVSRWVQQQQRELQSQSWRTEK